MFLGFAPQPNLLLSEIASSIDRPEFENYARYIMDLKDYLDFDTKQALLDLGAVGVKPPYHNPAAETGRGFIAAYAMPTTLAALYCFLISPDDFENSVIEAVMAGGDTDTCGAITGAISGAFNGIEKIPARWIDKIPALLSSIPMTWARFSKGIPSPTRDTSA